MPLSVRCAVPASFMGIKPWPAISTAEDFPNVINGDGYTRPIVIDTVLGCTIGRKTSKKHFVQTCIQATKAGSGGRRATSIIRKRIAVLHLGRQTRRIDDDCCYLSVEEEEEKRLGGAMVAICLMIG